MFRQLYYVNYGNLTPAVWPYQSYVFANIVSMFFIYREIAIY